jgi:hypothetical protein
MDEQDNTGLILPPMSQDLADYLIHANKRITDQIINFPIPNSVLQLSVNLIEDPKYHLLFDIDRKGRINTYRCTLQTRYQEIFHLIRLDLNGRPHDNPDTTPHNPIFIPYIGKYLPCPHLHLYQHGFDSKWALPMPEDIFTNPENLIQTFKEFCRYCTITEVPHISYQEQIHDQHL